MPSDTQLKALAEKWIETAASMDRESWNQRWDRERKMYCDGKARALRSAATELNALLAEPREAEPELVSVCCNIPIHADHRYCPKCGWECQAGGPDAN